MSSSDDDDLMRAFSTSPSADDNPTHNPPWPGVDPFAQRRMEQRFFQDGATIHFERLPKVQTWGPYLFISEKFYVLSVLKKVATHSVGARRRLTSPEVDAVSEHAALAVRQFAWTQPLSIAVAAGLAWFQRRTFKFPFYTPKKTFEPFIFPSKTMPLIIGPRALAAWHLVRFLAYCPLCWAGTALFLTSTSESSCRAHMMRDPRLSGLIQDINHSRKELELLARQESQQRKGMGIPGPREDGASKSPVLQQTRQPPHSTSQDYENDAFHPRPEDTFERTSSTVEKASPMSPSGWSRNSPTQAPPSPSNPRGVENSPQHATDEPGLFDDDDDASPVAASARRAEARQSRTAPSGSWERLRQQAQSGAQKWERGDSSGQETGWTQLRQDETKNTREASSRSDGFSYSNQDEEKEQRRYEKEQAQKDFDALLEAERRGKSSDGGGWPRSK